MKQFFILRLLTVLYMTAASFPSLGQQPAWDNTANKHWDKEFEKVSIFSSLDSSVQLAWFYASTEKASQPLIVSLHTWSGNYTQEDPIAKEAALRNWNYIHPDFQGPNNRPEACGSEQVIHDIRDAIVYAVTHANVDTANVHVIGVSGGGHAAMMAYLQLEYPVKSFHSWVGISNLSDWYWESVGRKSHYATDLEMVSGKKGAPNFDELNRRSPMQIPLKKVRSNNAVIHLYAGIHDGYTGSVPISHSIQFYNRLIMEQFPANTELQLSDSLAISLVTKRTNPTLKENGVIGKRKIHYQNGNDNVSLTIFEGTHEMLVAPALSLVVSPGAEKTPVNILTIGDSNGAFNDGWPTQLEKFFPYGRFVNKSIAGNTIGFDNLGREELNTLRNIEKYINETYKELENKELDFIFIGLGTNDAKSIFKNNQQQVAQNLYLLIKKIRRQVSGMNKKVPDICVMIPPPVDEGKADPAKYQGADSRISAYERSFTKVSRKEKTGMLNIYHLLCATSKTITADGVHLKEPAQFLIARQLANYINQNIK